MNMTSIMQNLTPQISSDIEQHRRHPPCTSQGACTSEEDGNSALSAGGNEVEIADVSRWMDDAGLSSSSRRRAVRGARTGGLSPAGAPLPCGSHQALFAMAQASPSRCVRNRTPTDWRCLSLGSPHFSSLHYPFGAIFVDFEGRISIFCVSLTDGQR